MNILRHFNKHKQISRPGRRKDMTLEDLPCTLDYMVEAAILVTPSMRIAYANAAAQSLLGRTLPDCMGQPIDDIVKLVSASKGVTIPSIVHRSYTLGHAVVSEEDCLLLSQDRKEHYTQAKATPIQGENNKTLGIVLTFQDFTVVRDLLQRQEQLIRTDCYSGLLSMDELTKHISKATIDITEKQSNVILYIKIIQHNETDFVARRESIQEIGRQIKESAMLFRGVVAYLGDHRFAAFFHMVNNYSIDHLLTTVRNGLAPLQQQRTNKISQINTGYIVDNGLGIGGESLILLAEKQAEANNTSPALIASLS